GHGQLKELIRHSVVEPVDNPLGHHCPDLRVVGQHLDGQALVDDLADLLLAAIRQGHPGAVGKTAVHNAYFFPQLIDEDGDSAGLVEGGSQLPQSLRHEPGLQTDVTVAHFSLDLRSGSQGRDGVDDDDVKGTRTDQHVGDLECLLTGVGLGDQQVVHVDPD